MQESIYKMNVKWKPLRLKQVNKITTEMIKDFLISNRETLLQCVLAVILYVVCSYQLDKVAITVILNDEYGYWANSSFLMGIEWPSITQNIAYYSYGYSFMLVFVRLVARLMGYTAPEIVYRYACVLNILFIVSSFFIATRVCKRYMHNLNWVARSAVCFVLMLYPANLFYSHITLTECALTFMFWVFIYIMMRITDKPSIWNHIAYGVVAVYVYVIHQRAFSVLMTAIIVAIFIKLVRVSRMRDVTAFFSVVYISFLLQTVMKKNIQNVLYLGNPKVGFRELMSYMFTKKTAVILLAMLFVLLLLYLADKGRARLACIVLTAGIMAAAIYLVKNGISGTSGEVSAKIAVNDFSGQWEKITGIFSLYGLIRLGTSIVGKWLYLAAATGLVICWGMRDTFVNAFWMAVDSVKRIFYVITGRENRMLKRLENDYRAHIWFLGVFLAWIGAFLISAIYKEGLYKVDDLMNGRYIEYAIGILVLYSVDRLLSDKHWFIMLLICLALYLTAGWYCQYVYDILRRTEFAPSHAVVLGLIFEKNALPTGKLRELARYVVPLSLGFILFLKLFSNYFSRYQFNKKIITARCIIALIIPMLAWNHISYGLIDDYLCPLTDKWTGAVPHVATWVDLLENGEKIYLVKDGLYYRKAELIQFELMDKVVEYIPLSQINFDEDAIYIINNRRLQDPAVVEKCEVVCSIGSYAVVINRNQEIMKRWNCYKEVLQR